LQTQCLLLELGYPVPGISKYGSLAFQIESLKFRNIKFGHESRGARIRERLPWQGPTATVNCRPVLSSERAPIITKPQLSKDNLKKKNRKIGHLSRMGPDVLTDWSTTVCCNKTLTFALVAVRELLWCRNCSYLQLRPETVR
jgi:hypothetical protein